MAKKKARKDGWKRVEQGIYKRVWADGSGGALLAKITLPSGAQKNSGSMPYFTNTRDPQATEAAVLKAVRRWRTDNLEAKDIPIGSAGPGKSCRPGPSGSRKPPTS